MCFFASLPRFFPLSRALVAPLARAQRFRRLRSIFPVDFLRARIWRRSRKGEAPTQKNFVLRKHDAARATLVAINRPITNDKLRHRGRSLSLFAQGGQERTTANLDEIESSGM